MGRPLGARCKFLITVSTLMPLGPMNSADMCGQVILMITSLPTNVTDYWLDRRRRREDPVRVIMLCPYMGLEVLKRRRNRFTAVDDAGQVRPLPTLILMEALMSFQQFGQVVDFSADATYKLLSLGMLEPDVVLEPEPTNA